MLPLFIRFVDWILKLFDGVIFCILELFDGVIFCILELFDGVIFCIFHLYLSSKYTRFISIESLTFVQNKFYIIPKMQM